jgi:hypothetical protein
MHGAFLFLVMQGTLCRFVSKKKKGPFCTVCSFCLVLEKKEMKSTALEDEDVVIVRSHVTA